MSRRRLHADSEPPGTPTSTRTTLTDVLNLSQQLTPRKTPRSMRKLHGDIQAGINDVEELMAEKDRHIADLENQAIANPRPARNVGVTIALFVFDEESLWSVDQDERFDLSQEFKSDDNRVQGQILDVLAVLPADVRALRQEEWVGRFTDGLEGECATIAHRIRGESLRHIVADPNAFDTSTSRKASFHEFIGFTPSTGTSRSFYSRFKAEVLYDEYDGTVREAHLFRNPILLKLILAEIFASIIRGPSGAKGLFDGGSRLTPYGGDITLSRVITQGLIALSPGNS
ncbi:hypothetical protein FB45DRAFT_878742 [Roridomyces roridus]|uniref:Uncharacterized protein n=1 Tax=Roridomyces roridus TaxID=1738132 RepID=A0AAD7F9E1_9AGAR|nr:hypothetical protein FB45DRAFT_878742 [Roridomyces roridus]